MKTILNILLSLTMATTLFGSQPDLFLSDVGKWSLFDDKLIIKIESRDGQFFYSVGTPKYAGGNPPSEGIPKGADWFLYPETESLVWLYQGDGPLQLITITKDSVSWDNLTDSPELKASVPRQVAERIDSQQK